MALKSNFTMAIANAGGGSTTTKKTNNANTTTTKNNTIKKNNSLSLTYVDNLGNMVEAPSLAVTLPAAQNNAVDTSYKTNLADVAAQKPTTYGQQLAIAQQAAAVGSPDTSGAAVAATATETPATSTDSASGTGSAGTTGGSTAGSGTGTVDTYEEFLLKQEGFYKEQLDKLNAQIEENKQNAIQQAELQRQETEAQAESERERGVINARSSYAQNLATYGANAEALASMGLSGSGYSDYLTQQAYATQRAETQNANAQAEATKLNAKYTADAATLAAEQQANSDKLNAELSYAENLQNNAEKLAQYQQQKADEAKAEEEQKYQNYLTVLDAAKSGNYTSEEIAQIAQNYGFDEAMVESLTNAASTAQSDQKTDSTTEYYAALLTSANSGDYTAEQLAELGKQYGLSEEQITSITDAANTYKTNTQKSNYSNLMIDVENRATNKTILDTALKNDNISQEQYNDCCHAIRLTLTMIIPQSSTQISRRQIRLSSTMRIIAARLQRRNTTTSKRSTTRAWQMRLRQPRCSTRTVLRLTAPRQKLLSISLYRRAGSRRTRRTKSTTLTTKHITPTMTEAAAMQRAL